MVDIFLSLPSPDSTELVSVQPPERQAVGRPKMLSSVISVTLLFVSFSAYTNSVGSAVGNFPRGSQPVVIPPPIQE